MFVTPPSASLAPTHLTGPLRMGGDVVAKLFSLSRTWKQSGTNTPGLIWRPAEPGRTDERRRRDSDSSQGRVAVRCYDIFTGIKHELDAIKLLNVYVHVECLHCTQTWYSTYFVESDSLFDDTSANQGLLVEGQAHA